MDPFRDDRVSLARSPHTPQPQLYQDQDLSYSMPARLLQKLLPADRPQLQTTSPLLSRTFKTEMQHTPLKSFTKLLERRKSTQSIVVLYRDQFLEQVITDMILQDILRDIISQNKVSEISDLNHIELRAHMAVFDSMLNRVMVQVMIEEVCKPIVDMHNSKAIMLDKIQEKSQIRQQELNQTFAQGDSVKEINEVLGIEKFDCVEALVREACQEAIEETLIGEVIDETILAPVRMMGTKSKQQDFRAMVRDVCQVAMREEVRDNSDVLFDSYLEQMLHKILLDQLTSNQNKL